MIMMKTFSQINVFVFFVLSRFGFFFFFFFRNCNGYDYLVTGLRVVRNHTCD